MNLKWKITMSMLLYATTLLIIGTTIVDITYSFASTEETIVYIIPALIVWALVFGAIFTKRLVDIRPVKEMIYAAEKVKSGDLNVSVYVDGTEEIGVLATVFNHMVANQQSLVNDAVKGGI